MVSYDGCSSLEEREDKNVSLVCKEFLDGRPRLNRISHLPIAVHWRNYICFFLFPWTFWVSCRNLLYDVPNMSALKTLRLLESSVAPATLGQLLARAPSLARFEYNMDFRFSRHKYVLWSASRHLRIFWATF